MTAANASGGGEDRPRTLVSRWLREPLLHFLLLGALLFAADRHWSGDAREVIRVDRQSVDYLIEQAEEIELRELSPGERDEVMAAFVEDEILYREAYRRGLDRRDSRMRRTLIANMRAVLAGTIPTPSEAELRAFFDAHRARYIRPETFDIEHVFYADPAEVPADIAARLEAGVPPATLGDAFRQLGPVLSSVTVRDVGALFGVDVARAITTLEGDRWLGPLESIYGTHLVRVSAREPPVSLRFEDVSRYIEADWALAESRRLIEAEVLVLRARYRVVIEAAGDGPEP